MCPLNLRGLHAVDCTSGGPAVAAIMRGKYSADGRWDRFAVDKQLGAMAIMLRMRERGVAVPF